MPCFPKEPKSKNTGRYEDERRAQRVKAQIADEKREALENSARICQIIFGLFVK